jgi:hypothetical protein
VLIGCEVGSSKKFPNGLVSGWALALLVDGAPHPAIGDGAL